MRPSSPKKNRHLRGISTLEFALMFPVFLLFLFSMVDMGRYYFMEQSVSHTLRAAARYAVTGQLGSNSGYNSGSPSSFPSLSRRDSIIAAAKANNPGFLSIVSSPTNQATTNAATSGDTFIVASSGTASGPWTNNYGGLGGQYIKLSLTNNFSFMTPFLDMLMTNISNRVFKVGGTLILKSENFSTNDFTSKNAQGQSTNYWN